MADAARIARLRTFLQPSILLIAPPQRVRSGARVQITRLGDKVIMNLGNSANTHSGFELPARAGVALIGLAVTLSFLTPRLALAQSAVWQPQGASTGSIYYNNGGVGIGTSSPTALLTLGAGANDGLRLNNGTVNGLVFNTNNAAMTVGTVSSHPLFFLTGNTFQGVLTASGNFGIGTTNPQYKLAVNGTIGAKDIIVTSAGWPDYVFRRGYRLRSLSEVSRFIAENGHLPDVPAEAEVMETGVRVGEMQAKLLVKIEELTLHLIQQEKAGRDLRDSLTKENRELRERLARLEGAMKHSVVVAGK